MKNSRTSSCSD